MRRFSRHGDAARISRRRPQLSRQSLPRVRRLLLRLPVCPAAPIDGLGEPPGLWEGTRDAGRLRYLEGGEIGCYNEDERPTDHRRVHHHLVFYGFLLCFAATCVATIYHYALNRQAPYPWYDLPVVLGTVGGVGMLIGAAGLWWAKFKRDPAMVDEPRLGMDAAFVLMLFLA